MHTLDVQFLQTLVRPDPIHQDLRPWFSNLVSWRKQQKWGNTNNSWIIVWSLNVLVSLTLFAGKECIQLTSQTLDPRRIFFVIGCPRKNKAHWIPGVYWCFLFLPISQKMKTSQNQHCCTTFVYLVWSPRFPCTWCLCMANTPNKNTGYSQQRSCRTLFVGG